MQILNAAALESAKWETQKPAAVLGHSQHTSPSTGARVYIQDVYLHQNTDTLLFYRNNHLVVIFPFCDMKVVMGSIL